MSETIIVSGAALPGIGEATTRSLISEGLRVIGTFEANNHENAKRLLDEFEESLDLQEVDHSSLDSLDQFVGRVHDKTRGGIVGIVSAQMLFCAEDPAKFDHDLWERTLAVNITAPNVLIHGLKKILVNGSSIVVITSTEAFSGSFIASAYAASKAAIHNLVKTHANNLGVHNIRVNAIAPGWIEGVIDSGDIYNLARRLTPLRRLGRPEEVANVVGFLLSDRSSFVNGSVITVDGGYTGADIIAKHEAGSQAFE